MSGPAFVWFAVVLQKFEGVVLGIVVDNAHDLLVCHSLFFTHGLARRCNAAVESSVLLK